MKSFRIVNNTVCAGAWLLAMALIGQKLYPESVLAEVSFGAAGLTFGLFVALGIEYFTVKLKSPNT